MAGPFSTLWRFATAPFRNGRAAAPTPPPESSPARREATRRLTDEVTAGNKPALSGSAFWSGSSDTPDLGRMLCDVEAMLAHPRVAHTLLTYTGAVAQAEFALEGASSPEVGEFALSEARRFWQRCLTDAQESYNYGRLGGELVYTRSEGPLRIDYLKPFAGLSAVPLVQGKDYWGVRAKHTRGVDDLPGPGWAPAKGFWHAHNTRYSRLFGFPQLYPAWRPWRRLAGRNGAEDIIDGGVFRFAFAPPIGRYPERDAPVRSDWGVGSEPLSNRERMREFMEYFQAGAPLAAPSTRDESGNYEWDWDFPDRALDVGGLVEYNGDLERQISLGIGVAPEITEASEVGSGYSGRAIPLEAFLVRMRQVAWAMLQSWYWQIGLPLLRWNYGPQAWARLTVEDLLATRMRAIAKASQPPQEDQQPPPQPGGPPGQPQQFATDGDFVRFATASSLHAVGDKWKGPSGKWFTKRPDGRVVPTADPNKPARQPAKAKKQPAAPKPPRPAAAPKKERKPRAKAKPKPPPAPSPQKDGKKAEQFERLKEAAKKELNAPDHPVRRFKDKLATVNFGSGAVRTLQPTKDVPLSRADHEAMDRAHSRTAAALSLSGDEKGSKAQLEAAKYHRDLAAKAPAAAAPKAPAPPAARPKQDSPAETAAKAPALAKFTGKLEAAGFSPEDTARRKAHVEGVVRKMPARAVERMAKNVDHVRFHNDPQSLGRKLEEYHGVRVPPGGAMGAYVSDKGGTRRSIHLDGIEYEGGDVDSDTLSPSVAKGHSQVQGTYAHEMTHAVDGPDHEHSNSPEWQAAFGEEIASQRTGKYGGKTWRLSQYASQSPAEGFAEFGRLMYATDVDHETIKKSMPKSYAYFQSQGLI